MLNLFQHLFDIIYMSFTPLDPKKIGKSKKKTLLNLKLILPLFLLFVIGAGILGGIVLQRQQKKVVYKTKAAAHSNCIELYPDKFYEEGDCIVGKNGFLFNSQDCKCPDEQCPTSSCGKNCETDNGTNRVCFTQGECGVEQLDVYFTGGSCYWTKCFGGICGQPHETPTPTPTPTLPTNTPTPTLPTNTPTPTLPTNTPTPTIRWLNCGERCDNVNQQYVKCWAVMGIPENHLVCVDTTNGNSYCSKQLLMQQCENLGLSTPYASCCTSVSVTPTNTPTPTTTLTPTTTPTGTPGPTSTPTNTPPPGSTNTPVPPTPTEIILVQATNTPAALAQATTVPTIVSVGTKPPIALMLLPIILIILALVF